jgi:hypothetical protein
MKWDEKVEEILRDGGIAFWILCIVFSVGIYGLLWFSMALGVMFDL